MRCFNGPTSPEYSFNVAQAKTAQHTPMGTASEGSNVPSMDESQPDEDDLISLAEYSTPNSHDHHTTAMHERNIFHFQSLISIDEAVRLAHTYQLVVGELHPICNFAQILSLINALYAEKNSSLQASRTNTLEAELNVLITNLVLCIALYAESVSPTSEITVIFQSCQERINAVLGSVAVNLNQVILGILTVRQPLVRGIACINASVIGANVADTV